MHDGEERVEFVVGKVDAAIRVGSGSRCNNVLQLAWWTWTPNIWDRRRPEPGMGDTYEHAVPITHTDTLSGGSLPHQFRCTVGLEHVPQPNRVPGIIPDPEPVAFQVYGLQPSFNDDGDVALEPSWRLPDVLTRNSGNNPHWFPVWCGNLD